MTRFRTAPVGRPPQPTAALALFCSLAGGVLLAAPSPSLAGTLPAASPCPRAAAAMPHSQRHTSLPQSSTDSLLLAQARPQSSVAADPASAGAQPMLAQAQPQVYPACTYTPGAAPR